MSDDPLTYGPAGTSSWTDLIPTPKQSKDPSLDPSPSRRGFVGLRCPKCGEKDVTFSIGLSNVGLIECDDCNEEFTPESAVAEWREQADLWRSVVDFVGRAPVLEEQV
jgi:hypothetical protein